MNNASVDGLHFYCKACDRVKCAVQNAKKRERRAPIRAEKARIRLQKQAEKEQAQSAALQAKQEARLQKALEVEVALAEKQKRKSEKHETALRRRRERHRAIEKRYRQSAKGKLKQQVSTQKKRARRQQLPDTLTTEQWRTCLDYFGYACAVCGASGSLFTTLAQDHWIPITDSGDDNPGTVATNIVPLCHSKTAGMNGCNNLKSNQHAHDWLVSVYGVRKASAIEKRIQAYFERVREVSEQAA